MKKLSLVALQEKARLMTREELRKYEIPQEITVEGLYLLIEPKDDERIFYLYHSSGGTTEKDFLIAQAELNIFTGQGNVEVFLSEIEKSK